MELSSQGKALLQELCTDSRIKALALAKKLQSSRYRVAKDVETLEAQLGLKYTLELDYKKLGFGTVHVIYLNFVKKPGAKALEEVVNRIAAIQLAFVTKGDFELVCCVVTRTPIEYSQVEIALQLLLQEYGASVRSNEVTLMRHGFIPLTNKLIGRSDIDEAYKKILMALNEDAKAKLSDVSKSTGISGGLIRYHLAKMEREGIIKRYTAIVTKPNTRFTVAYFVSYSVRENLQQRIDKERRDIIFATDERSNVNDFQLMFATTGARQTFNLATYMDRKYGIEHSLAAHNKIFAEDNPDVKSAVVAGVVKGLMPFRYMDVKSNYDFTNWPVELS